MYVLIVKYAGSSYPHAKLFPSSAAAHAAAALMLPHPYASVSVQAL